MITVRIGPRQHPRGMRVMGGFAGSFLSRSCLRSIVLHAGTCRAAGSQRVVLQPLESAAAASATAAKPARGLSADTVVTGG